MRKRIIRMLNIFLDSCISRVRVLFYPLYISARILGTIRHVFQYLCNEYLKLLMADCGNGVRIYGNTRISSPQNVTIGNNVHINMGAFLRAEGGLRIEDNVHIGRNLTVYTMNHNYYGECLPYDDTLVYKPVTIKKNVWIGMNVSITPGVTIGEGAIIGMGTLISKDIPPLAIVGGEPPKILKYRNEEHYHDLNRRGCFSGMTGLKTE